MPPKKRNVPPISRGKSTGDIMNALLLALSIVMIVGALFLNSGKNASTKPLKFGSIGSPSPPMGSLQTVRLHASSADNAAAAKNHQQAAVEYERALQELKIVPERPQGVEEVLTYNMALSLVEIEDHARAVTVFKRTLVFMGDKTKDARVPRVHSMLAQSASRIEDWMTAGKHFGIAGVLQPEPSAFRNSGRAYLNVRTPEANLEALHAFQEAQRLGPADPMSVADVGIALALLERPDDAAPHLESCRASDEMSAQDHMYVAGLVENANPEEARQHYKLALSTLQGQQSVEASQCYYSLGRVLRRLGLLDEEDALYEGAVAAGVWNDKMQRPAFVVRQPISTQPWHNLTDVAHVSDVWDVVRESVAALEQSAAFIAAEFNAVVERGAALRSDDEGIADTDLDWRQLVYVENGRRLPPEFPGFWDSFPTTVAVLEGILRSSAKDLPKGCILFSRMAPGTHLRPHSGPTNHRIRLHLGLEAPSDARLRVGNESRPWILNKALVFDDSFDHEVWIGEAQRTVLILDVWHPELNAPAREKIKDQLRFASSVPRLARGH